MTKPSRSSSALLLSTLSALTFATASLSADTLTLSPVADTAVISSLSSRSDAYFNYGGGAQLFASDYGAYANANAGEYGLLRFELPEAVKNSETASITSVTLVLTTSLNFGVSGTWSPKLDVYQIDPLNKDWTPGSSNGALGLGASGGYMNNTTSAPPILGQQWASGGLFNQAAGDTTGVIGSANLLPSNSGTQIRIALDIDSVREWITNDELAQAGLAVHLNTTYTGASSWLAFHSSRATNEEFRPVLEIEYEAIPEPKMLGLIVIPLLYGFMRAARSPQTR